MLRERDDEIIWDIDPLGIYTPNASYIKINADGIQREGLWWWKKLWKLNYPPKT